MESSRSKGKWLSFFFKVNNKLSKYVLLSRVSGTRYAIVENYDNSHKNNQNQRDGSSHQSTNVYLDCNESGRRESHEDISSGGTAPSPGYNYALIGCDFSLMLTSLHGRPDSAAITRNQLSSHPAVVSCLCPALFARSFVKIYCESNKCRSLNCRNRSACSAFIRRPEFVMGSSS